jgi:kumamolisin
LDIEYAHAMAPSAHIYLVEANSNSFTDLFNAVQVATACVTAAGGGHVSMSWGGSEFSGETAYDSYFSGSGRVTYLAAAGDSPGVIYPCASAYVLCVGGTTISRNTSNGFFLSEATWNSDYDNVGTGGGPSAYEPRPAYQNFMSSIVGSSRGVPDFALDADPETGVWIYNSTYYGRGTWIPIGGTSLASPALAGLFNRAGYIWASSSGALNNMYCLGQNASGETCTTYSGGPISTYITAVKSGLCGLPKSTAYADASNPPYDPANIFATTGIPWSFCAGWGTAKDSGNPD